jgi:lysozyme
VAYQDDDDGAGDLVFLALMFASAYVFAQYWRSKTAAAGGWGFAPAAPAPLSPLDRALEILAPMQLSAAGAAYIKKQEGFRAMPYPDPSGNGTDIGYGHQIKASEAATLKGPISRQTAEVLFNADAADISQTINNNLRVGVSQGQFDALVDFGYEFGAPKLLGSTLWQLLNSGDYAGAAQQFNLWVHSGGQVSQDLVNRRAGDVQMFNS